MLLEQFGIIVSNVLLLFKYLFVCIPLIITVVFLICEHNFKSNFARMFSGKITIKFILICAIFQIVGIIFTLCYSIIVKENIFENTYSSIISVITSCIYLFVTAFVEETAWRGFLLERLPFKKKIFNIITVGLIWTIWHLPMWIIRNSLGVVQILHLVIWTFLISIVLGTIYYQCKNIILIAILHATFNICYLVPTQYNIIVLTILIVICILVKIIQHKKKQISN